MTDYYAGPSGNNSNSGTSPASPKTLVGAAALAGPGDNVNLLGGTYDLTSTFYLPHSGTSSAWITYKNYNDTPPVFRWVAGPDAIDIAMFHPFNTGNVPNSSSKQYVEFRGLHMDGNGDSLSAFHSAACHHLRFINNRVYNQSAGGITTKYCDYIHVEGNDINHVGYQLGQASCISLNGHKYLDNAPGFHSYVLNNRCSGGYDATVHFDGNGIIMDLSDGISKNLATADVPPVLIANNVCFENGGYGIELLSVANIWVVNNTLYSNCLDLQTSGLYAEIMSAYSKNCYIINNIASAWNSKKAMAEIGGSFNINYYKNIYYGGGLNFTPSDASQFINSNPLFTNPFTLNATADGQYASASLPWNLTNEFYLQSGSPAIGIGIDPTAIPGISAEIIAGLNAHVFTDILGNARTA